MTTDDDATADGFSRRSALSAIGAAATVGLAGCVGDVGTGTGDGPITVGLQADRTGTLASYGFWHERVLRGYVEALNADDGIDGREVELVVEDTETDPKQGQTAMRKLVQQEGADFVIGSQSSGVSIATTPLAQQLGVPYFPLGEAPSITGSDGNRWVVRNNHNVTQAADIAVQYGLENLGTKWTLLYQDYSFGQQYRDAVRAGLGEEGEVLRAIPVEVGATDLNPYLNKVPDDTEVLFNALVGPSALSFLKQSADLGTPGARIGPIASVEGVDVSSVGGGAEGAAYVTMLPRRLEEHDTPYNRHLRKIARVDETDEVLNGGHYWASYEALSWIADAVEATGWASADDHQSLVQWFEDGPSHEASNAYPQGDTFFRGTDHQAFINMFIERISDGRLSVVDEITVSEPTFDPAADLASQSF
ncbi:MAG: ABC transporter substrate-binding protein [Halobacteriales archaeon]